MGTMAQLLGIILTMILTPILFGILSIQSILLIYGIVGAIFMILYLVMVRDKPTTPPNAYAQKEKVHQLQNLQKLIKNRNFVILLFMLLIGMGAFNAITSEIDLIFSPTRNLDHYSELLSGLIGAILIIGGIAGSVVLSMLSDKSHKRKPFLILAFGVATGMTLVIAYLPYVSGLYVGAFIFGFFLISALPIGLTYAAEITYPVPEEISNGFLVWMGQIGGILLILGFNMIVIA